MQYFKILVCLFLSIINQERLKSPLSAFETLKVYKIQKTVIFFYFTFALLSQNSCLPQQKSTIPTFAFL